MPNPMLRGMGWGRRWARRMREAMFLRMWRGGWTVDVR